MDLGYADPLYILAFDHRGSMLRRFGWSLPIGPAQHARVAEAKAVIYGGVRTAVDRGVAASHVGVLVDEEYGGAIPAMARGDGLMLALCIEKSGQQVFDFTYPDWPRRLDTVSPDFVKALVRYNPEHDDRERLIQRDRLRTLTGFVHATGRQLLLELIVPLTSAQQHSVSHGQADMEALRTELVIRSIEEFQDSGVEADVWKVEGMRDVGAYQAIADAARAGGRDQVGCVVLGAAAPPQEVDRWLASAAQVPAFIGFAVGRTIWWDEIGEWIAGTLSREGTVRRIGDKYASMVGAFRKPRSLIEFTEKPPSE